MEIAGSKRRAVLALLLLHANEVVRTERLIEDLWGERAPGNAAAALHSHVSRLRKAVGPELLVRREWGYVLRTEPDSIDLHRFEEAVASAEALPARERAAKLSEALRLWRGPPLSDLSGEPGLEAEASRLSELHLTTIERRIDADLEVGRNAELVGELETLIASNPLREHLRWQLILALYRAGRQAEALEVYRETRRVLTEELGLEPSPELRELERAILRHDPSLAVGTVSTQSGASPATTPIGPPVPAQRRRGWLFLGIAGGLLLAAGTAATVTAMLSRSGHPNLPAEAATSPTTGTASELTQPTAHVTTTTKQASSRRPRRHARHARTVHVTPTRRSRFHPTTATQASQTVTLTNTTAERASVTHVATTASKISSTAKKKHTGTGEVTVTVPVSATTIRDTFTTAAVNPAIWNIGTQGTGPTAVQQNGQLVLTFPADAVPGGQYSALSAGYNTVCRFDGDFNATVDYQVLDWPAANGTTFGLASWVFPRPNSNASRASSVYSESYVGDVGSEFNSVTTTDTHGTLRLARKNGIETAYYRSGANWIALESRSAPGGATIALQLYANGADFAHQQVSIALTNFSLTATGSVCP